MGRLAGEAILRGAHLFVPGAQVGGYLCGVGVVCFCPRSAGGWALGWGVGVVVVLVLGGGGCLVCSPAC